MPFSHKFQEYHFSRRFETNDSILKVKHYEPEVIFVGTYNHGWSWNDSDFFYGRGMYMWTVLANLLMHNQNILFDRRTINNNIPTRESLFEICEKGKVVFADIVKGIKDEVSAIEQPELQQVLVNNEYAWKSYKDKPLDRMGARGWLDDNAKAIIRYINETRSIKHVYFTFKSGNYLVGKKIAIEIGVRADVSCCSIFTPTVSGFGHNLTDPFNKRSWSLAHCWVWNGLNHEVPINKEGYGHLDHEWLIRNGVNPNHF